MEDFRLEDVRMAKLPCENCGRVVSVIVPFVGCVFCNDCMMGDSSWEATTEQLQDRWRMR